MPQKWEREVEEIVRRLDEAPPSSTGPGRVLTPIRPEALRPLPSRSSIRPPIRLTPAGMMIAGLGLGVLSSPMHWIYPPAATYVAIIAVVLFLGSLIASVAKFGQPRSRPIWRGQPMESSGLSGGFDLGRRWRRWRARRRFRDPLN